MPHSLQGESGQLDGRAECDFAGGDRNGGADTDVQDR